MFVLDKEARFSWRNDAIGAEWLVMHSKGQVVRLGWPEARCSWSCLS